MTERSAVTHWIAHLKHGDAAAAQKLWNRYAAQLLQLAQAKLRNAPKGIADEEDIAQSVFRSVCRGAAAGRFDDVASRDDLWWLLIALSKQKLVNHIRRETALKRGQGRVQSEVALAAAVDGNNGFTLDELIGSHPTPEFIVMLEEENRRLLRLLRDDDLRQIAVYRVEGYTVAEIAAQLSISTRSIERKLELIRRKWASELCRH
jgi:RNA polymerase sigma factor (sigma-70 family)